MPDLQRTMLQRPVLKHFFDIQSVTNKSTLQLNCRLLGTTAPGPSVGMLTANFPPIVRRGQATDRLFTIQATRDGAHKSRR